MKFSELKGRAVVSLDSATKLGEVEDLLLDTDSRETIGVKVKTGLFGGTLVVPIAQVKSVGPDAVTVTGPVGEHGEPTETDTPPQAARVAESLPTEHPDPVTEVLPES